MNYIYIETYGCTANQNNSEILAGILKQSGYEITNNIEIAEIIIINSCVVKGKTENKIFRRIQDLTKIYKNKLLIVAGCMPEVYAEKIKKLNSKAILLGTHHFKEISHLISDYFNNQINNAQQKQYLSQKNEEKIALPKISQNKLISIIQISEGCLGKCSYCLTRLAKGALFSYNMEQIVKSIQSDLNQGAKEIWITSQDNASYGLDKNNHQLPELLKKILSLKHKFRLRLGMMNPNNLVQIQDEILNLYHSKKMYKFLHIPIQSASDKVLKDMNRLYKIKQAEEIITKFKKEFPDITISTDIIIGYPTETEKDFKESLNFIKKFRPDVFNLSKFSLHKNTEIYKQIQKGKLKPKETEGVLGAGRLKEFSIDKINQRTAEIMKVHRETALENKNKFLNKTINVFIDKKIKNFSENRNAPGFFEARDDNYNIVLIKINPENKNFLGKTVEVKITQIGVHHMIGEINN